MSRSRQRLLLASAALLSVVALVGCGSGEDQRPSAKAPSAQEQTTQTPAPKPIPTEYDEQADARADIKAALAASRRDGKPVLLDFGADWCPDCRVLEKLYQHPAVSNLLQSSYHLVLVDVGEFDANLDVAFDYVDLRTSGIPALAVVRDGKTVFASNRGEFATARSMKAAALHRFLRRWA